ncbi:hypothetical protein E8E14_008081 [Neopestalotiopsis sp. 37M]|nr:hypothetical protein E8E14_008081 [Neopestalotiopsis sp. 37M]
MSLWTSQQARENMQNTFRNPSEALHAAVRDSDRSELHMLLSGQDAQSLLKHSNYAWGTPLHVAVWCSDLEALQLLLAAGADALLEWDLDDSEFSAMQLAAAMGDVRILSVLWKVTPPHTHVNGHGNGYGSCLISASGHGQAEIVGWLFAVWNGWAAEITSEALTAAVSQWHQHVVQVLLQHVDYDEAVRYDMLEKACGLKPMPDGRGLPEYEQDDQDKQRLLVCRLMNTGLNPNHRTRVLAQPLLHDGKGQTVMHRLASPQQFERTVRWTTFPSEHLLASLDHGGSISTGDENGETPLHLAAAFLPCDIVSKWLSYRQETQYDLIVQLNNRGESLLHYAAAGANIPLLQHLLRLHKNALASTKNADNDDGELTRLIHERSGLDVNAVSSNGWTPFLCALSRTVRAPPERSLVPSRVDRTKSGASALQAARLLISAGAEPGAVPSTQEGWTPLHSLAGYKYLDDDSAEDAIALAEELIAGGADVNARAHAFSQGWHEKHKGVPWQWHLPWGFRGPKLMAEHPGVARGGVTPLHWAAENGCICMAKVLLAHGADPLAKDDKGSTPETTARYFMRYRASTQAREDMIQLLKQTGIQQ